jgi:hypothetical protein
MAARRRSCWRKPADRRNRRPDVQTKAMSDRPNRLIQDFDVMANLAA